MLLLAACAPARPPSGQSVARTEPAAQSARTLAIAIRVEPSSLATKPLTSGGVALGTTVRLFNATLALLNEAGVALPYLAETLPRLHEDTWTVAADGSMETRYRLRPNVTWQDGTLLGADDFVFAWQVYATPALGLAGSPPLNLIESVREEDPRTIAIRWRRPYPLAGQLTDGLPPLPRQLLEPSFSSANPDAFASHPFWTREFVGLGPFRVDRWEPSSFILGSAYDGHVLGRPKIERIRIVFIADPNTTLANVLSDEVQLAADDSIKLDQTLVLQRELGPQGAGAVVRPEFWRASYIQFRPELLATPALLDPRVRRALAHSVDRAAINQALFEGGGLIADVPLIPSTVGYYAAVLPSAVSYPFDPGRTQALLQEAGFTRGGDGIHASSARGRLSVDLKTNSSSQNEAEMSMLGGGWRAAGFDVQEGVLPAAQAQDGQVRASFPGLFTFNTPLGEAALAADNSAGIPRPENRWTGNNRGGWMSLEFDRLSDAFTVALEQPERVRLIGQMVHIFSDEVPAVSLYFGPSIAAAYRSSLIGPKIAAPGALVSWDVHLWELR